jgi:cytochrome b
MSEHGIRVWDLPLRLFHWLFAGAFATAWLTRDDRLLHVHVFAGYLLAGMVAFRLLWGLVGSRHSRFRDFACGPRAAFAYLRAVPAGRAPRRLGHNPAGSWAILGLLALGSGLSLSGLLTLGGEEGHGPLAGWIGFAAGDRAHRIHEFLAWTMLALVAAHLIGVVAESLLHRENLAAAMIHGRKRSQGDRDDVPALRPVALLIAMAVAGGAWAGFGGYLGATQEKPYLPFAGPVLPDDPVWREECGSCHLAYHPSLLPARSWERLLAEQESHFGEDLMLEPETVEALRGFLPANGAESLPTEAAWKILRSIPATGAPLRISATSYWKAKHRGIDAAVFDRAPVRSPANCGACHRDAEAGTFEDAAMYIPEPEGGRSG